MIIKLILVLAGIALPMAVMSQFVNALIIPDTIAGTSFNLTMGESDVNFLPGDSTYTYGINADYLGPTLIFNS